jgi:hypothetical protein
MAESSWHLGVYSWSSCYVKRWWDGFCTQVHTIRCAWVPTATSHRARHLRSPLPEAWSKQCFRWERWERQIGGEIPSAHANRMVVKWWRRSFLGLVLFRLVAPSSAWSGGVVYWYGVYGSPAICRWMEPIVSRILGCNWQPTVPGVEYLDMSTRTPSSSTTIAIKRVGDDTVSDTRWSYVSNPIILEWNGRTESFWSLDIARSWETSLYGERVLTDCTVKTEKLCQP